jgi:hypothetical protein
MFESGFGKVNVRGIFVSGFQGFKGSKVQGFKGLGVQGFRI